MAWLRRQWAQWGRGAVVEAAQRAGRAGCREAGAGLWSWPLASAGNLDLRDCAVSSCGRGRRGGGAEEAAKRHPITSHVATRAAQLRLCALRQRGGGGSPKGTEGG
jgi:hypothetical protein